MNFISNQDENLRFLMKVKDFSKNFEKQFKLDFIIYFRTKDYNTDAANEI